VSCEDKKISLDELISNANFNFEISKLDDFKTLSEKILNNEKISEDDIDDLIEKFKACQLPATPIYNEKQLDDVPCKIDDSKELPIVPDKLIVSESVSAEIEKNKKISEDTLKCIGHVDTVT